MSDLAFDQMRVLERMAPSLCRLSVIEYCLILMAVSLTQLSSALMHLRAQVACVHVGVHACGCVCVRECASSTPSACTHEKKYTHPYQVEAPTSEPPPAPPSSLLPPCRPPSKLSQTSPERKRLTLPTGLGADAPCFA